MKAFLLAAGLGTRLRPLTLDTPKCLIPVCGKPILHWWIELFEKHNVSEVLINLHHLPEKIEKYINSISSKIDFELVYEDKLLGSAGTLKKNKWFVEKEETFFVCYADNLTNYDLSNFINFHKKNSNPSSMALFRTDNPKSCGIVNLNHKNTIIDFQEKPQTPKGNIANAGLYIFSPEVIDNIPDKEVSDIGFDLLPKLIGRMTGWKTKDYLIDIGTLKNLKSAEKNWLIINTIKQ
jgi:mannose-1-phosphate guanylyltransferase